ncbi:MAG: ribonuclease HII [Marinilabiliaceae bacterium]|nr:ribonuclease HII [Marinilabiliaceae bacterium]
MLERYLNEGVLECGVDEAGRGCLAGPVVAAAVILPSDFESPVLNDSKKLTVKQRNILRIQIEENAIAWAVCMVDNHIIDEKNILQATYDAMHGAISELKVVPEYILVDGNRFRPYCDAEGRTIPHSTIVKGDGKMMSIAAASILAKTHRDEYMEKLSKQFPQYGWQKNKGYPTADHRTAILENGFSSFHRVTFTVK